MTKKETIIFKTLVKLGYLTENSTILELNDLCSKRVKGYNVINYTNVDDNFNILEYEFQKELSKKKVLVTEEVKIDSVKGNDITEEVKLDSTEVDDTTNKEEEVSEEREVQLLKKKFKKK